MFPSSKKITLVALGPVLALSLVACGGSSSGGSGTAAAPNPNSTSVPGGEGAPANGQGFGGQNQAEFAKIQACLSAAGIALPTRTGFPRPSGSFTPNPNRTPGIRPSGAAGRGFGGGMFADPKVQAALKACGISVPTFRGPPSASPSA